MSENVRMSGKWCGRKRACHKEAAVSIMATLEQHQLELHGHAASRLREHGWTIPQDLYNTSQLGADLAAAVVRPLSQASFKPVIATVLHYST